MSQSPAVTALLVRISNGDRSAESDLLPIVYAQLERMAKNQLRQERPNHTLQPAALVHEAYLRLTHPPEEGWKGKTHFFAVCTKAMRQILTDYARQRNALKRAGKRVQSDIDVETLGDFGVRSELVLSLDQLLTRLASFAPRQATVVELRFYGGMAMEDIAEHLGVTYRTVQRDWRAAKAWLMGELEAGVQSRLS
jgi:RNA polymerase sigma-70 factor, ECF subfamily